MEPRVPVTIEARLGYRNKGDPEGEWKEYATSTEVRTMDCSPPEVNSVQCEKIIFKNSKLKLFDSTERWIPLQLFSTTSV